MGGEGGGVLTGWIVAAAQAAGLAVQATSVPGVAQRTGGTTYYIEMAQRDPDGRAPVFALTPVAGEVDIVLASELLEAARAARLGYVTPDRTDARRLHPSRLPDPGEDGDGRRPARPGSNCETAAQSRAQAAMFLDMEQTSRRKQALPISPVMLGALAGVPRAADRASRLRGGDPRQRHRGRTKPRRLHRRL